MSVNLRIWPRPNVAKVHRIFFFFLLYTLRELKIAFEEGISDYVAGVWKPKYKYIIRTDSS